MTLHASHPDFRNRVLVLTPELRDKLKQSIGITVASPKETEFDSPVAAVGDVTFHVLLQHGVVPFLSICDMKTRRGPEGEWEVVEKDARKNGYRFVQIENPPGKILPVVWDVVEEAIGMYTSRGERTFVHVKGEEDLIALVVIALIPEGWYVTYGMPGVGMHVVRVGEKEKNKTLDVLREMAKEQ